MPLRLHAFTTARLLDRTPLQPQAFMTARLYDCPPLRLHAFKTARLYDCMPLHPHAFMTARLYAFTNARLYNRTPLQPHAFMTTACLYERTLCSKKNFISSALRASMALLITMAFDEIENFALATDTFCYVDLP